MKLTLRASTVLPGPAHGILLVGARVAVATGERWFLRDATRLAAVAALPRGAGIAAADAARMQAVVTTDSKAVRGVQRWRDELWDLARGKRLATLAENHPDDNWGSVVFTAGGGLATRRRRRAGKGTDSLIRFDATGAVVDETTLTGAPMVFRIAASPDGTIAAHAYFDGRGGLVAYTDGKPPRRRKLGGRITGIGRDHDKGVSDLAFDATGAYLLAMTHMGSRATVWSTATGKVVAGAWTKLGLDDAFFVGDALCAVNADTLRRAPLGGGAAGKPLKLAGHPGLAVPLGDDRHVVWCGATARSDDKALRVVEVWDLVRGVRVAALKHPANLRGVWTLAARPDLIALGAKDGRVTLIAVR